MPLILEKGKTYRWLHDLTERTGTPVVAWQPGTFEFYPKLDMVYGKNLVLMQATDGLGEEFEWVHNNNLREIADEN